MSKNRIELNADQRGLREDMKCKSLKTPVFIETPRLMLKMPTLGDVQGVRDAWNLDGGHLSLAEATAQIERILLNQEKNQMGTFVHLCLAIVQKCNGRIIGWCGIAHDDQTLACPVIFILLKKAYWRQGFATEAGIYLLRFSFSELGLERVEGTCATENLASKRVMEKIGMCYVGIDEAGANLFRAERNEYLRDFSEQLASK